MSDSIPDGLELLKKIRFHFGGAKDIDLLVGIESVEIATTGYDKVEVFCQINKVGYGAHSFVKRVMTFQP